MIEITEFVEIGEHINWLLVGFALTFFTGFVVWAITAAIKAFVSWIEQR